MTGVREPTYAALGGIFGKMGEFGEVLRFNLYYLPCSLDQGYSLSSQESDYKAQIPLGLLIHRELTKTPAKGAQQNVLLHPFTVFFPFKTIYFYILFLKWTQMNSKWISL